MIFINMNHNCSYFQTPELKRELNQDWPTQPRCQGKPFFNIPLDHIMIEELHLMLRITDRLKVKKSY